MDHETEFSAEQEPTEIMVENQENARDRAEDDENQKNKGHNGEVTTEEFDLSEALSAL